MHSLLCFFAMCLALALSTSCMATFGKVPADKHNITTTIAAASTIIQFNNDIKIHNMYVMRLYNRGDCGGGFLKNEDTAPLKRTRYGVGDGMGGRCSEIRFNSVGQTGDPP